MLLISQNFTATTRINNHVKYFSSSFNLYTNGKGKGRATEEEQIVRPQEGSSRQEEDSSKSIQEDMDLELARRLQQEEDEQYARSIIDDPSDDSLSSRLPKPEDTEYALDPSDPCFFQSEPTTYKKTNRERIYQDFEAVKRAVTKPHTSTSDKTSLIEKLENKHGDFLKSDPIKNLPLNDKLDKLEDHLMDLLENSSHLSSPASESSLDTIKVSKEQKTKDDSDEGGKPSSSGTTSGPSNPDNPSSSSSSSSNHRLGLEDIYLYFFMCFSFLGETISNILDNFFL
jgi:hypothetical protein